MGPLPYLTPKILLPSRQEAAQEAARQGVTSILEDGSHMRTTEPPHYYPRPSMPASFHPHTGYDLLKDSITVMPKTHQTYGTGMDAYLSFVWSYTSKFVYPASPFSLVSQIIA
jgi:hypothetical protein